MASMSQSVLVSYGSETGNAQDIAEDLGRALERLRFKTTVEELNDVELKELLQHGLVIFVTSTTGQGEMPQNAVRFWRSLLRRKLPPSCLSRLNFTTFGLGDSSYPKFNWAARKLSKRLTQLGAQSFFQEGEADERHDDGIDTVYLPWKQKLCSHLVAQYPPSEPPIPDDEPLPLRFSLSFAPTTAAVSSPLASAMSEDPPVALLPIPGAIEATVCSNIRVTPTSHWQDVRLLTMEIDRPAEPLQPGATVTIYPKNSSVHVQTLIDQMGWQDQADCPINPVARLPRELSWCASVETCTLRDLLTHGLDITAVPRRGFLEKLFFLATNAEQKERLKELIDPNGSQDFYDYATRPRRTILEVLGDFPSVRIPPSAAAGVFPAIRGREFSIANGGARLDAAGGTAAPRVRLEILAAMVEYRTIIRKPRVGLCSRYLRTLAPGARISVTTKQGAGMQQALERPVVAIATGTGVAPIRMLHHARLARRPPPGEMLLFFGCRSRGADFYFADEWRADSSQGLTVVPAFSRDPADQPPGGVGDGTAAMAAGDVDLSSEATLLRLRDAGKNYVQHCIRRHARKVTAMVRDGAVLCICGSAGTMPKAVRLAIQDALVAGGLCASVTEAETYLATKVDIWQETW